MPSRSGSGYWATELAGLQGVRFFVLTPWSPSVGDRQSASYGRVILMIGPSG
jgi:hypothetical protein